MLVVTTTLALVLSGAVADCAPGQAPRKSQRGAVVQMIGTTRVEITYTRPSARGRALFGALVPWGRVWNPGADTATAISLSAPLRVNGERLAAGSYSIWAIPGETEWTLIFSRATPIWHTPYPAGQDVLRVKTTPQHGAHMETLAFYFPVVDGLTAELDLRWGEVIVPLKLEADGT